MANRFEVFVVSVEEVRGVPGAWSTDDSKALLKALELEDLGAPDLELVHMALQDVGEEAAPLALVNFFLTDDSSPGARAEVARDFVDECPWDQYPDLSQHWGLWRAAYLLQGAFPGRFSSPTVSRAELGVVALDPDARALLRQDPLPVSFVARLLAGDGSTPLARLFADEVDGAPFRDAPSIVWRAEVSERELDGASPSIRLRVWSSNRWLGDLDHTPTFQTAAWPDEDPAEDAATDD